jgi:hypothetical protein
MSGVRSKPAALRNASGRPQASTVETTMRARLRPARFWSARSSANPMPRRRAINFSNGYHGRAAGVRPSSSTKPTL